jgi:hypothetical protein
MPNKRKHGKRHAGAWLREDKEYAQLVAFAQARGMTLSDALAELIKRGLAIRLAEQNGSLDNGEQK